MFAQKTEEILCTQLNEYLFLSLALTLFSFISMWWSLFVFLLRMCKLWAQMRIRYSWLCRSGIRQTHITSTSQIHRGSTTPLCWRTSAAPNSLKRTSSSTSWRSTFQPTRYNCYSLKILVYALWNKNSSAGQNSWWRKHDWKNLLEKFL